MAIAVAAPFNTNPVYTGNFIPQLWTKKLNAKYYVDNQLTEIVNTNWEGEIKSQGDSVRIRTAPTLAVADYVIGTNLSYQVPAPVFQDMTIDKAKSFAFQVNDVLQAQADLDLMNMFMTDAAKQLKIAIADETYFDSFVGTAAAATAVRPAAAANQGALAGIKSANLNLGTDAVPISTATPGNLLTLILSLATAMDEQNVPEDGRFLLISPYDRQVLMNTTLAQAYFTGDSTSIVRTGLVGTIDRFKVYVSNMLPRGAAAKAWVASSIDPATGAAYVGAAARRMVIAGHKDAVSFANQVNKTEQVRNPNDFGDFVRGLSVYGRKVVKPEALAIGVVV
jgi:hypothetical protein